MKSGSDNRNVGDRTPLGVRRLEREDLPVRVAWFNAPGVFRQMTIEAPLGLAQTQKWFEQTLLDSSRRDFAFFQVATQSSGRLVAMGGLTRIDPGARRAELYVVADPEQTGKGHGTAATKWLCNYGFLRLGLHRLFLTTTENNERARSLYERLGFRSEGCLRCHIFHNGRVSDQFVFGILRQEWEKTPWRCDDQNDLRFAS